MNFKYIDNERLMETLVFIGKLLVAGLVFRAIIYFSPPTIGLQSHFAQITDIFLTVAGISMERNGHILIDQNSAYIVTQDCLGWKSMAAFTGLVFASTGKMIEHSKILLSGLTLIVIFNFFRVLTTIILSHYGVLSFEIIHTVFWKWGMTVSVLAIWGYWLYQR